jgi:2-phospho-L-lactate guanylyltransferase
VERLGGLKGELVTAALLPVKEFSRSKERLSGYLAPGERAELARTMFEDVWEVLREATARREGVERLLVVTAEPYVAARCRKEGIDCLEETESDTHSDSVRRATKWAMGLGVSTLLSVPIDSPGMTATEILALARFARQHSVVLVPSVDGSGTNALVRTPPDAIDPCFGPGSCRLHIELAEKKGLDWLVVRPPGLLTDIDTPEDVEEFLLTMRTREGSGERPVRTAELLRDWFRTHKVP